MSSRKSILVIDDEDAICYAFRRFFEARGWDVYAAASAREGVLRRQQHNPDVVFLDVRLPDCSGLDVLTDLRADSGTAVIVMTAYSNLSTTVRAVEAKAFDYLVKPLDLDQAIALAERAVETHKPPTTPPPPSGMAAAGMQPVLIGDSPAMQAVYKRIARASQFAAPVLISGATGTGKELVARAIHDFSSRRGGPFVAVNCGALPEALVESELFGAVRGAFTSAEADRAGRFELANGGTLLLDEVSELPLAAQVKLLRVLDSQDVQRVGGTKSTRVDVRVMAATNRDLGGEVRAGRFRADLYYRLAVLDIHLPLLCERSEDIIALAEHFLAQLSTPGSAVLSPEVRRVLLRHSWPGNVRELRNAMSAAAGLAPNRKLRPEDLPESVRHGGLIVDGNESVLRQSVLASLTSMDDQNTARYSRIIEQVERTAIEYAMKRCHGRQVEAALYLGLHRNTLRNRIRELQLTDLKE